MGSVRSLLLSRRDLLDVAHNHAVELKPSLNKTLVIESLNVHFSRCSDSPEVRGKRSRLSACNGFRGGLVS